MSIGSSHFCNLSKQAFCAWVDKIEGQQHVTKGAAGHLKAQFEKRFASGTKASKIDGCKNDFTGWLERAKKDGHFTKGNVDFIKKKLTEVLAAQPKASSNNTTAKSTTTKIKEFASRDGFVAFYDKTNPITEIFGNFYQSPVQYNGDTYQCAEGAFQAQKFTHDKALMAKFKNLSGDDAFKLARSNASKVQATWHSHKGKVMQEILREKFKDANLKDKLLATGKSYLVEHTPVKGRDTFWSDDNDGTGQNMLGKLLMQVRGGLGGHGEVKPPPKYFDALKAKRL